MSSVMPKYMIRRANDPQGFDLRLPDGARGFVFNGDPATLVTFLRIGTTPNLR
jgi:hypothetical protein